MILATAIEQSTDSISISDSERKILYISPAFTQTTGYTREETSGKHLSFVAGNKKEIDKLEALCKGVTLGQAATEQAAPTLPLGKYIKLSVTDTGHDISPAISNRIFDPFFTTKEMATNTGKIREILIKPVSRNDLARAAQRALADSLEPQVRSVNHGSNSNY